MTKKILYTVLILIVLFLSFFITGRLASESYEGTIIESFPDRQIDVWRNLIAIDAIPLRKPDVEHLFLISDGDNIAETIAWREELRNGGTRSFRVLERDAPSSLVVELYESDTGVTGTWEFILREIGNQTEVTISEVSRNTNTWLRAYYTVLGRDILLRRELKSLRVSLFQRLLITP